MDNHVVTLSQVCRVGGCRFRSLSRSTAYPAKDFVKELNVCFGLEVDKDVEGVHPPAICVICRQVVRRCRNAVASGHDYVTQAGGCGEIQQWEPHSPSCLLCNPSIGRPKKRKTTPTSTLTPPSVLVESVDENQITFLDDTSSPALAIPNPEPAFPNPEPALAIPNPGPALAILNPEQVIPNPAEPPIPNLGRTCRYLQLKTSYPQPRTNYSRHRTSDIQPRTTFPNPEQVNLNPEPVIRSPEQVIPDPEQTIPNLNPEPLNRNPEPMIPNPEPVFPNPEPVIPYPEPVILNTEPVMINRKPAISNPEPGPSSNLHTPAAAVDMDQARKSLDDHDEIKDGLDCSLNELLVIATPQFKSSIDKEPISPERLHYPIKSLVCPVCRHLVDDAVESPCCEQVYCAECIYHWLGMSNTCPNCQQTLATSKLVKLSRSLVGVLRELRVSCDYASTTRLGYTAMVPLESLRLHVTAQCSFRPAVMCHSPLRKVITPSSTVSECMAASPSKLQNNVVRSLTAHMIGAQEVDGFLDAATSGKPQTWMKVTRGQVPSQEAAERTLRQRTTELRQARSVVSASSCAAQQADELKRLRKDEQQRLLEEAGLCPCGTQHGAALAMKCDLGLPWYRLRKLRRWLSSFGISMDSESNTRRQVSEGLPFKLIAERVPMADKTGTISLKPMVRFSDLPAVVKHYLAQHEKAGTLVWHTKEQEEVWVKIGGDHGGGTFKLSFQLGNVRHPYSVKNTVPFLVFAAKDTPANLATAFKPYGTQLRQLGAEQWQGKRVRPILFGDYEFLCSIFGLSGPSGVRPCLFCLAPKKEFQKAKSDRPTHHARTLQSLADDYEKFCQNGARIVRAREFNNVIRPALLHVPIDDVCVPALHLDLGIFPWIFEAMLADLRLLDGFMAQRLGSLGTVETDSELFLEEAAVSTELETKEEEQEKVRAMMDLLQTQVRLLILHKERKHRALINQ